MHQTKAMLKAFSVTTFTVEIISFQKHDEHQERPNLPKSKWLEFKRAFSRLLSNNEDDKDMPTYINQPIKRQQSAVEDIMHSFENLLTTTPKSPDVTNPAWLTFPFLTDDIIVKAIKQYKVMFVMRGLSGSGKSTIVKELQRVYENCCVCSADNYFFQDGVYQFDAEKLSSAHESCKDQAKAACMQNVKTVIIDNTNVKYWEAKNYFYLASEFNYIVFVVTPKTPWRLNPEELCRRNKHGVDLVTIHRKVSMFEDFLPFYYGWFLSESLSQKLVSMGQEYLKECLQLYSVLKLNLQNRLDRDMRDGDILRDYFHNQQLLHCTAKFIGKGRADGGKEYYYSEEVQNAYGHVFTLTLYGFTITGDTIGARVHLPETALALFDKPEEQQRNIQNSPAKSIPSFNRRSFRNRKKNDFSPEAPAVNSQNTASAIIDSPKSPEKPLPAISKLYPLVRPMAKGRSAHMTLGTAHNIQSKQTTIDVLDICDMEKDMSASAQDFQYVKGGKSRCFDDNHCCIYLDKPYNINVIFTGYY